MPSALPSCPSMIAGERMPRRDLRSDRLTTPWLRQKESATTGIHPEHGLDNENPGQEYHPTLLFSGDLNALARVLNKTRAMPPDDSSRTATPRHGR
jgi:hypothetical protein